MGNPHLSDHVYARLSQPAPAYSAVPPMFPELRQCATCSLCEELRYEPTTGERMVAACTWQGDWWFPMKGCDRWQFDLELLGEEGLDEAAPAPSCRSSSNPGPGS